MGLPSSFRDPHARVFEREGVIYRQVNVVHGPHYDHLMSSGLHEMLVSERLLIQHEEVDLSLAETEGAIHVLRPERIPFVSYPYEWGFLQLRDAALTTLRVASLALEHGMSLRDASAYNVTFHRGRPTFLDTTSFETLQEGRPWVAYRQFCEHFLAPLALMSLRDPRLGRMLRANIDGIPLDLAVSMLPKRIALSPGLLLHLRLHARSQVRHSNRTKPETGPFRPFSLSAFKGLLESLRKAVEKLDRSGAGSVWSSYYDDADHYSSVAFEAKLAQVARWIDEVRPTGVWDLGANTGRFARLASSRGIDAIGFEMDVRCVDDAYADVRSNDEGHFLPLVMDLADPSSGIGWAGEERPSLEERGPADLILALALVHHLAIANNVPLGMIADYFARLGRRAIVEFVPKDDPKVKHLLSSREDVFSDYSAEGFEAAFSGVFNIVQKAAVGDSGRTLYLMEAA